MAPRSVDKFLTTRSINYVAVTVGWMRGCERLLDKLQNPRWLHRTTSYIMWYNGSESFVSELYSLYALVLQAIGNRSIFYFNPAGHECNWSWFQQHNFTDQPQWVWHSWQPYFSLQKNYNNEFWLLACLSEKDYSIELMGLSETLEHLKDVRVIIELTSLKNSSNMDSLALNILKYFRQENMLNVALYFQNSQLPLTLYSFKVFPKFNMIQRLLSGATFELFPKQVTNLNGFELLAMHDYSEPNTILYRDANGKTRLTGFLWHFIKAFGDSLGAKMTPVHPTWPPGRLLSEPHMLEFTRNGSVDFGLLTVQASQNFYQRRGSQYSYPVFMASWCIMLPLERPIRRDAMFEHILETKTLALLLITFGCFCLSLGSAVDRFPMWRCLRLSVRFLGLFVVCLCLAQLFHLMVTRPQLSLIKSFDDLIASGLHVFGLRAEFDILDNDFRARYAAAFRLTSNLSEFFRMRTTLNTSWAYSISSTKWYILEEQQRHFQRPLFRYSDLCLTGSGPDSMLMAEDSIYKEALKHYIMRTQQSGLLLRWLQYSLYDMVEAGRMQLKDHSVPLEMRALGVQDFRQVWGLCGAVLLLALIVFGIELLWFYVNVCLNHL
ncbi:uncharacterized protein LOC133836852 [Drosophila sulfurigaster albostrigata]|uniref:uncharacterized protein LOC133836852 n=1 Tax=Drosophila sulfurigaster albostrigata TaxID=89887 RepID=UPI002D21BD5A|nr:uncharacterized protein LOC133836852 [Drosophila sulfurigaster albostrigata]